MKKICLKRCLFCGKEIKFKTKRHCEFYDERRGKVYICFECKKGAKTISNSTLDKFLENYRETKVKKIPKKLLRELKRVL